MAFTDFSVRWGDYLNRTALGNKFKLVKLPIPDNRLSKASSQFLTEIGMPDAAGFRFDLSKGLRKVYAVYGPVDLFNDEDRNRLNAFLMLGLDQGGNPLCLELANEEHLVFLNHERHFEVRSFVNSSVAQLAECILVFQEMVEEYQNEFEDGELYEGNVPRQLVEQTLEKFNLIDPMAVGVDCYWPGALEDI